ncbi:phosphatase PAP2 family protein [Longibaculum muris]|uniref:phosphatase PAP2 family protein n=1 Tax=Longibaculum muris TaxID=1796628 RepID=UPI0012B72E16|nr:phosphatase PAP2 family protein [Longibaculum muris]
MKKWLSEYKHAWVFLYFVIYLPWYFGLQQRGNMGFHDVYTSIDHALPFVSWFIYPYIYWFLFVAGTIAYLFFTHKKDFYRCVAFLFIGMTVCLIVFTVYPTSFDHRPEVIQGSPLATFLVNFIYTADKSQNVFPSIHVFNSIGCAIALIKCNDFKHSKGMITFASVSAIMITLSTMFIKQHSILDAISACVLAIILYILIYKLDVFKIEERVDDQNPRLFKNLSKISR